MEGGEKGYGSSRLGGLRDGQFGSFFQRHFCSGIRNEQIEVLQVEEDLLLRIVIDEETEFFSSRCDMVRYSLFSSQVWIAHFHWNGYLSLRISGTEFMEPLCN